VLQQLAGLQRTLRADAVEDLGDVPGPFPLQPDHVPPGVLLGSRHPPAQVRVQPDRQEGRLVRPELEQVVPPVGQRVERRPGVGTEPAEEREVVGPAEHVDRVDLHHGELLGRPAQLTRAGLPGRTRIREPLGGQGDPPRQGGGQPVGGSGHGADPAVWVRQTAWCAGSGDLPRLPGVHLPSRPGPRGRADVRVRRAQPGDETAVARVQLVTWRAAYRALLPAEVLDAWDEQAAADAWAEAIGAPGPDHGVLVALESDDVVGVAAFAPARIPDDQPAAELTTLLVEPRWGRRGHGSRLLAAVADLADERGVRTLLSWVPEADDVTAGFLQSAGWAPDGWARDLDSGTTTIRQLRWHTRLDDDRGVP
jgi:GNAT superfamily N-acetyltransferase